MMRPSESASRERERRRRSAAPPIVPGLDRAPGIGAPLALSPRLGSHLRALAHELLVSGLPGSSLSRFDCELIAVAASAANQCISCTDSHAATAVEVARRTDAIDVTATVERVALGYLDGLPPRLAALIGVALGVARLDPEGRRRDDVEQALRTGASAVDVQHAVAIAAAAAMGSRLVEGLGAATSPDPRAHRARAAEVASHGYDPSAGPTDPPDAPPGGPGPAPRR